MLDGNTEEVNTETSSTDSGSEYDGGRDISKVVAAAATDTPVAAPTTEAAAPATVADQQKAIARAWKVYREDQEVKDFDPATMSAADFLALKIGYNANGKEQRRDFEGLLRNAQQGHYNASKTVRLEQEREHAVRQWHEHRDKVTNYENERKVWTQALTAATRNNFEPLKAVVAAFQKAMDEESQPTSAPAVPEGYVARADLEAQRAGEHVFNTRVMPEAERLGKQFGFPAQQVATAIMKMVEQYPSEYLTDDVLTSIMTQELPAVLTQLREEHPIPAPEISAEAKKIAELEQKLAALTESKVEAGNKAVEGIHKRRAAAPPGVPTVAAGSGLEVSGADAESAAGMRKWLKNLK